MVFTKKKLCAKSAILDLLTAVFFAWLKNLVVFIIKVFGTKAKNV